MGEVLWFSYSFLLLVWYFALAIKSSRVYFGRVFGRILVSFNSAYLSAHGKKICSSILSYWAIFSLLSVIFLYFFHFLPISQLKESIVMKSKWLMHSFPIAFFLKIYIYIFKSYSTNVKAIRLSNFEKTINRFKKKADTSEPCPEYANALTLTNFVTYINEVRWQSSNWGCLSWNHGHAQLPFG